jgi:tetratricopeptide (TPR) repeat protein
MRDTASRTSALPAAEMTASRNDTLSRIVAEAPATGNTGVAPMSDPLQLAHEHQRAGRLDQAEALYRAALDAHPNDPRLLHLLGTLLLQRRQPALAVSPLRQAAQLAPTSPDAHFALADALRMSGDPVAAETAYRTSLSLRPLFPPAHNGLGLALVQQEKLESAVAAWRRAIQLKPDYAEAHANLGAALAQLEKPTEAAPVLRRAVELNPQFAPAHNNLANVLDELEDSDGAVEHWTRALQLLPNYFDALVNLGRTLQRRGEHDRALELLNHAITLRPTDPDARFLRGLALLLRGNLEEGFADYAFRMQCKELKIDPRNFSQSLWDGSPQPGKTILLRAEQGFGDVFQFVRYAPMVRQRVGHVVLECQAELAELMRTVRGIDTVAVRNQGLPPFDVHAPLLDLPRLIGTTLTTIPADVPYISADPARVENWAQILAADPPGKRVGLVWSGNPHHKNDRNRSILLREFEPLADLDGVTFLSLQKGAASGQASDSTLKLKLVDHTPRLTDFAETAALLSNLDLIITVDTSVAHLAGALARPTWVLLPFAPDWRWMLKRTDSPWYPTMRLFRQSQPGQWEPVIGAVSEALRMEGRR